MAVHDPDGECNAGKGAAIKGLFAAGRINAGYAFRVVRRIQLNY
jgi:hypothetical protein